LAAEARLTAERLGGLQTREAIRCRLEALSEASSTDVPWREGYRVFFVASDGKQPQPALYMAQGASGEPRVAVDPNRISPDGSIAVRDFVVSPGGRLVAFRQSRGGEDLGEVRVWEVESGRDLGESVPGVSNLGRGLATGAGSSTCFRAPRSPARSESANGFVITESASRRRGTV
jgi:prolyl oligopeptidase